MIRIKLIDFYYEVKYFFQKIFIGYSDYEVIELGYCTQKWMLPRLVAFRRNLIGHPVFTDNHEEDQKLWEDILDEIIFSIVFQIYDNYGTITRLEKKLIKELILDKYGDVNDYLIENPEGDVKTRWTFNEEKRKVHDELLERSYEGLKLIGEYMGGLWL